MNDLQTIRSNGHPPSPSSGGGLDLATFTESTPVVIPTAAGNVTLTVKTVLDWLAPGAPPADAIKFLAKCRALRLNPLADEIYLLSMGGKWATVIAKSGYLKRALEHEDYDGHEAGIIVRPIVNAHAKQYGEPREIQGTFLPPDHIVVGGWCRVYRKGISRPFYISVGTEYFRANVDAWQRNSPTMYCKVAIAQGHRTAFAIGDAYDESEAPEVPARLTPPPMPAEVTIEAEHRAAPEPPTPAPSAPPVKALTHADRIWSVTLDRLRKLVVEAELNEVEVATMLDKRGVRTGRLEDLDEVSAQDCIRRLNEELSAFPWERGESKAKEEQAARAELEAEAIKAIGEAGYSAEHVGQVIYLVFGQDSGADSIGKLSDEQLAAFIEHVRKHVARNGGSIPPEAFVAGNTPRREPKATTRKGKDRKSEAVDSPAPEGEPAVTEPAEANAEVETVNT